MSFLIASFYDSLMAKTEQACLTQWRQDLLAQVSGEVLEIGAGTGANIRLYPGTVSRLVLTEPDRHMRRALQKKLLSEQAKNVSVIDASAEQIGADDESFDYVVSSLVCCSVSNLEASLGEVWRVLRPGGSLVFLEHVAAAPGSSRRRWQNAINPLWKTFMGNCHLNRETERAIISRGFEIIQIERESMRKAPSIVRPTIRGIATKAGPEQTTGASEFRS